MFRVTLKADSFIDKFNNPFLAIHSNDLNTHLFEEEFVDSFHFSHVASLTVIGQTFNFEPKLCIFTPKTHDVKYHNIYVSKKFLELFPFHQNELVIIEKVILPPLEKVIIGVMDDIFKEVNESELIGKLSAHAKEKLLCQKGYPLVLANSLKNVANDFFQKMIIVECYPTSHGLITTNTSLCLVHLSKGKNELHLPNSAILMSKFLTFQNIVGKISFTQEVEFDLKVLSKASSLTKNLMVDPQNSIFLTSKAMHTLNVKDGQIVELFLYKNNNLKKQDSTSQAEIIKSRRVFLLNIEVHMKITPENLQAIITPQLLFNMNQQPTPFQEVKKFNAHISKPDVECATETTLALVSSHSYPQTTASYMSLLLQYFSTNRLIHVGDIICLDSRGDPKLFIHLEDAVLTRFKYPVIYCRVSEIVASERSLTNAMTTSSTSIYLTGTCQSFVPRIMESFYSPLHPSALWDTPVPVGLQPSLEKLLKVTTPFLTSPQYLNHLSPHILLAGPSGSGKTILANALSLNLGLHFLPIFCPGLLKELSTFTESALVQELKKANNTAPCLVLLKSLDTLVLEKDGGGSKVVQALVNFLRTVNQSSSEATVSYPIIVIATVRDIGPLPTELFSVFLHNITLEALNEQERLNFLSSFLSSMLVSRNVSPLHLARRTAGFSIGDLVQLVSLATKEAYVRIKAYMTKHALIEGAMASGGVPLIQEDLLKALDKLQATHSNSLGTAKIPEVRWDDVGGLSPVKKEILDTIQLPIQFPELLASGLRRSGVLLYGPPGTGKTLLAKAVATECSLNFFSVKGPELLNMYVGQSEENVREVFTRAREAAPCIIFFDELDSLAPNRGRSGDSGGVMDRVVSQLLAELDGMTKSNEVFVIGATNRPDLIDPALLRPGRFDKLIYVGVAEDASSRKAILAALTKKFKLSEDAKELDELEAVCPPHLTGADFYALCSSASLNAISRTIADIESGLIPGNQAELVVTKADFLKAIETLTPSLSEEDLRTYDALQMLNR